jgi:type VI secretion system (T6SS) effector TldE1-like protein
MGAQLTYYLFEGVLVGTADGKQFHISAASGGGGGSTKSAPADSTNNPYSTGLKTLEAKKNHVHGGAIPPGKYTIAAPSQHPHLGRSAQLVPAGSQPMYGRGGFFIHGRGPHGSDGCIVPLHPQQFTQLMQALEHSKGGALRVEEAMGGGRFA